LIGVDSPAFLGLATLLVLGLRLLPAAAGRMLYAAGSLAAFAWVLRDPPTIAVGLAFAYLPYLLQPLARRAPRVLIALQFAQFLWLRHYLLALPWFRDAPFLVHAITVIGASYVILRQVDWIWWLEAEPEASTTPVEYTAFMLGLFTLLAGPVVPYAEFRESAVRKEPDAAARLDAAHRIVNGYVKLALIAPFLARVTAVDFVADAGWSTSARLLTFYGYPLYIYLNFAGYCDVVIGIAALANVRLPENFDRPFLATNVQVFWQRWHMTFSQWARHYVLFPSLRWLRGGPLRRHAAVAQGLAVLATFVFVGLWHGPTISFLLFGVLHGLAVLAVAPYGRLLRRAIGPARMKVYETHPVARWARTAVCFHFLCLTIMLFERTPEQVWHLLS
jgi:D-alanyl-lipoteichoic acid acyltransferase DltB (MBOAT superfamily)